MLTIFEGTYRGNKISLTEIPGTDGQVDLLVKVVNNLTLVFSIKRICGLV